MAHPEHEQLIRQGVDAWNAWRLANLTIRPNLREIDLQGANLSGIDLRGADLYGACLYQADLSGANFSPLVLNRGDDGKYKDDSYRPGTWKMPEKMLRIQSDDLTIVKTPDDWVFVYSDLREVRAGGVNLANANLSTSILSAAVIAGANLKGAHLKHAILYDTRLTNADLTGASFDAAIFKNVDLRGVKFDASHPILHDGSDSIKVSKRDRWLNWSKLRAIGSFPVFSVSWSTLAVAVVLINGIAFLNQSSAAAAASLRPMPIPERMTLILLSSLLLVIGSTAYRLLCPNRVQTFSETEWVEREKCPRLQYFAESHRRRGQMLVAASTLTGGVLAIILALERVIAALRHSFGEVGFFG